MPIDRQALDAVARAYAKPMTSIRGRRVHRLLMREFARFDLVVPADAEDGSPMLLALAEDGGAALCRSDGRGPTVEIAAWAGLEGATVTTAYDFLKDSLPVVRWTLWHPSFALAGGALTIAAKDLSSAEVTRVTEILRGLGR
jgi:hypothetical protein